MAQEKQSFTSPVGRLVAGSLYKPQTTDAEGKPLVYRHGPNINQPKVDFYFAVAIPKGAERHWAETSWGAVIWQVGHAAFPQAAQSPAFAWKVQDGDSQIPNTKGKKPCDREGYRGHWVLTLSGGYAPKTYTKEGDALPVQVTQEDFIKPGYWVQVVVTPDGNGSDLKPGVKLWHSMVCLRGGGAEITYGPDVASAGFGAAPMPAGVAAAPVPNTFPIPAAPAIPGMPPPPPSVPGVPSHSITAPAVPSVPVTPNLGFLQGAIVAGVPAVPALPAPTVPPPPVASPSRTMTAKAGGATYEQFIAGGWSEQQIRDNGMMV